MLVQEAEAVATLFFLGKDQLVDESWWGEEFSCSKLIWLVVG